MLRPLIFRSPVLPLCAAVAVAVSASQASAQSAPPEPASAAASPAAGSVQLTCAVTPAAVRLDDEARGDIAGPDGLFIDGLTEGAHSLVVEAPGYQPLRDTLLIRAGETLTWSCAVSPQRAVVLRIEEPARTDALEPLTATLQLSSVPPMPEAAFELLRLGDDGAPAKGGVPLRGSLSTSRAVIERLAVGSYRLTATRRDATLRHDFTLSGGEAAELRFDWREGTMAVLNVGEQQKARQQKAAEAARWEADARAKADAEAKAAEKAAAGEKLRAIGDAVTEEGGNKVWRRIRFTIDPPGATGSFDGEPVAHGSIVDYPQGAPAKLVVTHPKHFRLVQDLEPTGAKDCTVHVRLSPDEVAGLGREERAELVQQRSAYKALKEEAFWDPARAGMPEYLDIPVVSYLSSFLPLIGTTAFGISALLLVAVPATALVSGPGPENFIENIQVWPWPAVLGVAAATAVTSGVVVWGLPFVWEPLVDSRFESVDESVWDQPLISEANIQCGEAPKRRPLLDELVGTPENPAPVD